MKIKKKIIIWSDIFIPFALVTNFLKLHFDDNKTNVEYLIKLPKCGRLQNH